MTTGTAVTWLWFAVSFLTLALAVCGMRLMALSKQLRQQRMERLWLRWRCQCGRRMYGNRTTVADGKGMLHSTTECVPDTSVLTP